MVKIIIFISGLAPNLYAALRKAEVIDNDTDDELSVSIYNVGLHVYRLNYTIPVILDRK